jgi:hypothetical protein
VVILRPNHKTVTAGFDAQIRKSSTILVFRLNKKLTTDFEAEQEKTVTIGFEVKPEKTYATDFEVKPEKLIPVILRSNY